MVGVVTVMYLFAAQFGGSTPAMYPDPGIYNGSSDVAIAPSPEGEHGSLIHNLSGARINTIQVGDASNQVSVGKATGLTNALEITADDDGAAPPVQQYVHVESLTLDDVTCPSLTISNSEVYSLVLTDNVASGISIQDVPDGDVANVGLASLRGAHDYGVDTTLSYDYVSISGGAAGADVKSITVQNFDAFGAPCIIEWVKAGTLTVTNSQFGDGTGINSPSFTVAATVSRGLGTRTVTGNTEEDLDFR